MILIERIRSIATARRDYWRQAERLLIDHPGCLKDEDLKVFFRPWLTSLWFSRGPFRRARLPVCFPAARFIEGLLSRASRVCEFGAGGSTLFFARRVGELVTVDHDSHSLKKIEAAMRRQKKVLWRFHLSEPFPSPHTAELALTDPESYASEDARYAGMSFVRYATTIEQYDDNYFDIVSIHGAARPSCFKHAIAKVKFGGYVMLNNAECEQYAWIEQAARKLGFEILEFWGPGPYGRHFWKTAFFRKVRERFALNDLDVKLERYLDFDAGTFVEAGANDGVAQSNSLYFEACRGWRGLLVEPIPHLAQECRRYRPHAIVEEAALVASEREERPVLLRYANLMSTIKGSMRTAEEEDAHIASGSEVQKIETYELSVAAATLSSLLDKHGLRNIDLLCLDVEGYELNALRGLDLSRHRPRYILVEARYRDDVHAHLSREYDLVEELSFHDLLYRLRSDTASITTVSH